MISVTSNSLAAREKGPMAPAKTGLSSISSTAFLMASTYSPLLALPTLGTSRAFAPSSSSTIRPTTVGTSLSDTRMAEPKHSASTERSIRLTAAAASVRCATSLMPSACLSLSEISSFTLIPRSCTAGKDRTGMAFFTGAA